MKKKTDLPKLRTGLKLALGPRKADGGLVFLIEDTVNQKRYETTWVWYELLRCWEGVTSNELLEEVRHRGWVIPAESDLAALIRFLGANHLLAETHTVLEGRS